MSERKIKRALHVRGVEASGCGDEVTFKVNAFRKTKAGNYEEYALELKACRYSVTVVLRELRKMHVRDRERLAGEQRRIEREVRELTQEQAP